MPGFTLPSATLLAQSVLSGIFVGALYGLMGLGLSLSWGLLRIINLAHFAFAFLAAYICFQLASHGVDPLLTLVGIVPAFFALGVLLHWLMARFRMTTFNSLLLTFGLMGIVNPVLQDRVDWPWFIASQVAFGMVAGLVVVRQSRMLTQENLTFAMRAGIEAPGMIPPHGGDRP